MLASSPGERLPNGGSAQAETKERTKRRPDGQPVHSLRSLLRELVTLTVNRVCSVDTDDVAHFDLLITPTPLQHEALERLGRFRRP